MTEAEVLEKLKIFKDALIKKNEKISELEKTIKEDNDLIEGLTNSNSDYQEKLDNNDSVIAQQLAKLTEQNDKLKKEIEELKSRAVHHDKSLDVDGMMERIHTLDVDTSIVDETMKSIKRGERLFKQYSFGVANENTLNTFITFINNIYENAVKKDRFYILNRPEVCKTPNMNDNTYNTFIKYLYDSKLIEKRGASRSALEYVSVYSLKEVIDKVSKEC